MNLFFKARYRFLLLIGFFIFASCSRTVPEITFGFIQLVQYQNETGVEEYFSFFIIPEDEDGVENLDELILYNDNEQLRWLIKSDEWITFTENEKTWIGTRSIAIQKGMTLPRGVYRAVLVNKGGEKGERNFTFDYENRYPFPVFGIAGGIYTIKSEYPQNHLVFYDNNGKYISTAEPPSMQGNVSELKIPSTVRTAALWAEDPSHFCSAITSVVPVR
jgi:hypothetical protein